MCYTGGTGFLTNFKKLLRRRLLQMRYIKTQIIKTPKTRKLKRFPILAADLDQLIIGNKRKS